MLTRLNRVSRCTIVVFRSPSRKSDLLLRRIVALPRDVIEIREGRLLVNNIGLTNYTLVSRAVYTVTSCRSECPKAHTSLWATIEIAQLTRVIGDPFGMTWSMERP